MAAPTTTPNSAVLPRLLTFLRPFAWWVAAGVLLGFATIGSSVGLMAVSAYLISKAAIAVDVTQLSLAIAGVRLFALARALFRYAERYVTHLATFRILTALRVWFYRAIEPLAPARLQQVHSGDLLARIGVDIETLENFYVRVVTPPLTALLVTLLAAAILGAFDLWLGVALVVFLALTGAVLPWVSNRLSRAAATAAVAHRRDLTVEVVDLVQGMADLVAYAQAGAQQARILAQSTALEQAQQELAQVRGLANGLTALFTGLAGLTVLGMAIPLVGAGRIDGVYLALLPLTAMAAFECVQPLGQAWQLLATSQAAATRLFGLVDLPPAVAEPPSPLPRPVGNALVVRDLSFRYPPPATGYDAVFAVEAGNTGENVPGGWQLQQVSFAVRAGERLAITGASGAGKSTLAALLLRFWEPEAGAILLDGRDLREYAAEEVRALIAVAPQTPYLFHTSIRDNLLVADPDADDATLTAACRAAQIHDFIAALPDGYDTLLGDNGLTLSGGERQRLALARALLKRAPILILDEATAHLDAATAARLWQALEPFLAGRIVLILDHSQAALAHATRRLALDAPAGVFQVGGSRATTDFDRNG